MTAGPIARRRRRDGFALPLAILVLTLLALLAAAAVEASRGARRSSALAEADATLQSAAEAAVGELAARWPVAAGAMRVGERTVFAASQPPRGVVTSIGVTRISLDLWWVTAEARLAAGVLAADGGAGWASARRRVSVLLAVAPRPAPPAALAAGGSVTVTAPLDVGVDSAAVGCPPELGDSAMLVVGAGDSVEFTRGAAPVPWRRDAGASPDSPERWGVVDWATLAAAADVELAAGATATAAGGCAPSEWGSSGADAAAGGCAATWRVVHAAGDLTVSGGSGAGVLIVDGRLRIEGAFRYSGLVVARGGIDVVVDGTAVTGAVVAGGSGGSPVVRLGGATVLRRSRCAVSEALARGSVPRPAPGRWWAELL